MIYFNFKYRGNDNAGDIILLAVQQYKDHKLILSETFDLRNVDTLDITNMGLQLPDRWCCYNGMANLVCFIRLGVDIRKLDVVDLFVECMLDLTSRGLKKPSLLQSLAAYNIDLGKLLEIGGDTRNIILGLDSYSDDEWQRIEHYGLEDVVVMPKLLSRILCNPRSTIENMLDRGEIIKSHAILHSKSSGFPVNLSNLNALIDKRLEILNKVAEGVNSHFGVEVYSISDCDTPQFKSAGFIEILKQREIPWQLTKTGQPRLDQKYLQKRCERAPGLDLIYHARNTIQALGSTILNYQDLVKVKDGWTYLKPSPFPLSQITGRATPKPAHGFILNLSPFLRNYLIKPGRGASFVGVDWAQQEILIAGALSGDERLIEAYYSGDIYMYLAKHAGLVPRNATKSTHGEIRNVCKTLQLGIGYGMGLHGLSARVFEVMRESDPACTLDRAHELAKFLLDWHYNHFKQFWTYTYNEVRRARSNRVMKVEGWYRHVDNSVPTTQLLNFTLQATGAQMLYKAVNYLRDSNLDVVCTLHDAIYINSKQPENDTRILVEAMDNASIDTIGYKCGTDISTYNDNNPFSDPRGERMENIIGEIL